MHDQSAALSSGLDPADDFTHTPPTDVPGWTENFQWCITDASGAGLMSHIGTLPTDPQLWHAVTAVRLPDGRMLATKHVGPSPRPAASGTPLGFFDCTEPYHSWTCHYHCGMRVLDPAAASVSAVADGAHAAVRVDLELSAGAPVWVPAGDSEHPDWGFFHHEQAIKARGEIVVDGETFPVDAVGHRDHSTGPRDLRLNRRVIWANGTFASGWSFATMWGVRTTGESFERSVIFTAEGRRIVAELELDETVTTAGHLTSALDSLERIGGSPGEIDLVLGSPEGDRRLRAICLGGMNWTVAGATEWCVGTNLEHLEYFGPTQNFARWECDGETGWGFLDRSVILSELSAPGVSAGNA